MIEIPIQRLDPDLPLPEYAHPGDAGIDLYARVPVGLPPAARALIPTGIAIALPEGYAGLVLPRSGLALKHGITVLNAPGLIDSGYRGELKVLLLNTAPYHTFKIERGLRIAQLVIQRVVLASWRVVDELETSERGDGGYGSTGS